MMITIPTVGSCLTLTHDWTFDLWAENRNEKFWRSLFGDPENDPELLAKYNLLDPHAQWRFWYDVKAKKPVTLVAGTILKVSRIYIRQSAKGFDSITFTIVSAPTHDLGIGKHPKLKGRFWAKLEEVNRIEANWDEKTLTRRP